MSGDEVATKYPEGRKREREKIGGYDEKEK